MWNGAKRKIQFFSIFSKIRYNFAVWILYLHKQGKKAFALGATKGFWILLKAKIDYKMNIRAGLGELKNE